MTCYLTDNTTPEDIAAAKEHGVVAFKLYPAGATTNSDSGVTRYAGPHPAPLPWHASVPTTFWFPPRNGSMNKVVETLRSMAELGVVLCVHGEVTDPEVDVFDREKAFIDTVLKPTLDMVPDLKARGPPGAVNVGVPRHLTLFRNRW